MKYFGRSLCIGLAFLAACSSSKPAQMESTVSRVCQKVDECNFLPRGVSASECEDATQACLDERSKSERADWFMVLEDCLPFSNCGNFEKCARKIDYCGFDPSADDGAAGGSPATDAGVADLGVLRPGLIQFAPMYSAYDGEHTFQLTPSVPSASSSSTDADPVDASTLEWQVDSAFVKVDAFTDLPAAVLLTTKKAGKTVIKVSGMTKRGVKVRGEAQLMIAQAKPEEWASGDERYSNGSAINTAVMGPSGGSSGPCGLPTTVSVPKDASCTNCHNSSGGLSVEQTPTQTAGYSDDQLLEIVTQGVKPSGGFTGMFLKNTPMPDCLFKGIHSLTLNDDQKKGIVWKLRSLTPMKQESIDIARLRAMAGAAGSGSKP
jgi:hypothetical protein